MSETRSKTGGSVDRTLAIVELMALADQPMRLSDMAHQLDIPKSAAHRILTTLIENGWAHQNSESECYNLTLRMALVGQRQLRRLEAIDLRQPILDDLAQRTKELVRLTSVQNGSLVWIGSSRGRRSGLVYEADMSEKIIPFATANGKAWLASMPREEALRIALDAGLGREGIGTGRTITTIEALSQELDLTAKRAYGLAQQEAEDGVGAVAVAIEVRGKIVGTMSVAAPLTRLPEARVAEILPMLRAAADNMAIAWESA
ncbi:MAG: IclR family transcriptional regulator [Rhizobiales bacterium 65-79]|jgi:DNA-binding IclR family transcriptional regulator|nr:IclR family transcriptional regulator [Hyphomicrobiales bacterium]OJU05981.1 MAG: IclR family transcriptional regulator [Rhizobiales bacterium 65-79]